MKNLYKIFLCVSVLSVLAVLVMLIIGYRAEVGLLAVIFFLTFAVGIALIIAGILHNTFGYLGARLVGMDEKSCRTIAIEVGLQNGGLAQGFSLKMGKIGTMGLAAIVFGTWMNISGSVLANWWRRRPVMEN